MNTAGYEWAARVRAQNEIEVAKARAAHAVCVPMSAGGDNGGASVVRHMQTTVDAAACRVR